MKDKFLICLKTAGWILLCSLSLGGCGNQQKELKEISTKASNVQETIPDKIETVKETTSKTETGSETKTTSETETIPEIETTSEKKETEVSKENKTLTGLEQKWNEYWADGEFTFEETELFLQEAGYEKSETGLYEHNNGAIIDAGIAYEFIRDGYVYKQLEDGSLDWVSSLENEFGEYDSDSINSTIRSYGYEIEYNNDKPYVYDDYGNSYSYDEFASLLLNGETIPYAPDGNQAEPRKYIELLLGEWVSAGGKEITISDNNGIVWLNCSATKADGSKIIEAGAEIQIDSNGAFTGYYDSDSWGNAGRIYGEYEEETNRMYLVITVDVDGGSGWSCQTDDECARKYPLSLSDFASVGMEVFQNDGIWSVEGDYYIDIWKNEMYCYIDMYYNENGALVPYQYNCMLDEDENGIYFNISDAYCYGKVYLTFCSDNENIWLFTKMDLPCNQTNATYYESKYADFFNRKIYSIQ